MLHINFLGPTPVPLLGNLHQIFKDEKITFLALHKIAWNYGKMATIWMGPIKHILVSGPDELKVLLKKS
jgi:hypothetical protein